MAPTAVTTRDRILDEAERLFAREGVQAVTTRRIVEAAEQRNTSAVTYHFGSRQRLLLEILARRGGPVDEARGELRDALGPDPSATDLVSCLVEPFAALLASEPGRAYLRIVDQLRGRFAAWRVESDEATTANLARVLDELEARAAGAPAIRRQRVVALIVVLTGTIADRARQVDEGIEPELDHAEFTALLTAMCASVLRG